MQPTADPLTRFLRDPHGMPQDKLDRLLAVAHRLSDADLESLNRALARRHGFDPEDLAETARLLDEPAPLPIVL